LDWPCRSFRRRESTWLERSIRRTENAKDECGQSHRMTQS
jgi:hypothetical protein